jgi:radical SAM superfamily enzyme YgiQ (UPF0313 family)
MRYQGTVIRPPNEAASLIVQATLGCSDNACNFCPAYKRKRFHVRPLDDILKELEEFSRHFPDTRRIFLADGDAICMPLADLLRILETAKTLFPRLTRVGIYGSAKSLRDKSVSDLERLREAGLGILYFGVETGDPDIYAWTGKYGSPEENLRECLKVKQARIRLNTTVILGLGGRSRSGSHAEKTAALLNRIRPDHVAALTLMLVTGTRLHADHAGRLFELPEKMELVRELERLVSRLDDFRCLFFANHASNYFPVQARFPYEKSRVEHSLRLVIERNDPDSLTPDFLRGL